MKKIFLVSLAAMLLLVGAGCTTTNTNTQEEVKGAVEVTEPEAAQEAAVKVVADSEEEYNVKYEGETSALALLQKASSEHGFQVVVEDSEYGQFISAIGDKTRGADNKYWMYYVNGEMAAVGAGEYIVQAGDIIEFRFE